MPTDNCLANHDGSPSPNGLQHVIDPDTGEAFAIGQCEWMGCYTTQPKPANLDAYYTEAYHGNRHGFTSAYCHWRRKRLIKAALKKNRALIVAPDKSWEIRWLDVGCGDGTLLDVGKQMGWQMRGVEKFPASARDRGHVVYESLDAAVAEEPFDGASLWHVLEHLEDPREDLMRLHGLLKPGGALMIAVPDAGSWAARFFGPHWMHWDVPRHLYHFTAHSLTHLLESCGFQARQLSRSEFEYDLLGFTQSVMNSLGVKQNAFFKMLTGRPVPHSPLKRWAVFSFGCMLCLIAALPVWILGRLGRAGTLVFEARKK